MSPSEPSSSISRIFTASWAYPVAAKRLYMYCGTAGSNRSAGWRLGLRVEYAVRLEREPERQPLFGVVEILSADLGDAAKAIQQRVAVNVQRCSGARKVAEVGEEGFQCLEQLARLPPIIVG